MRFYIIAVSILLILLLTFAFVINAPLVKTKEEQQKVDEILNNISFAEILLIIEKIEKIEKNRACYTEEDRTSMEKKLYSITDLENLYSTVLTKEIEIEHDGFALSFNEMAALLDAAIKSIREMTLVIITIEQLIMIEHKMGYCLEIIANADISGLLNLITLKPEKQIEIMFAIKVQLFKDSKNKLKRKNMEIQSLNIPVDYKFLEYGCYYIFDTTDYQKVISDIILNIFNSLGNLELQEENILFS